jgi:hypothetical protein
VVLCTVSPGLSVAPARAAAEAGGWTTAALSEARVGPAVAQVGTQVLLAGGCNTACEHPRAWGTSSAVDIYDFSTGQWAAGQLSQARKSVAAASVGSLAIFAGGATGYGAVSDMVDVYDAASVRWSTARLSQPRSLLGAATVGTQAVFVGGYTYASGAGPEQQTPTATVDIFDAATGQWRAARLSQAVVEPQVATLGHQMLVLASHSTATTVDLYDADTSQWSAAPLSRARSSPVLTVVGSRALIIGGDLDPATGRPDRSSATVDLYDARTGGWSTASPSQARHGMTVATVGTQALFVGGDSGGQPSATVDIYDASTGEWAAASLSEARDGSVAVTAGDQVLVAGGYRSGAGDSASVDLYDGPTGAWSTAGLAEARQGITAIAFGPRALFAGGTSGRVRRRICRSRQSSTCTTLPRRRLSRQKVTRRTEPSRERTPATGHHEFTGPVSARFGRIGSSPPRTCVGRQERWAATRPGRRA